MRKKIFITILRKEKSNEIIRQQTRIDREELEQRMDYGSFHTYKEKEKRLKTVFRK